MKIIAFNGKYEDGQTVNTLKNGGQMMTLPRARVMHNAINSLSKSSSQSVISNLLDVASNNQYGVRQNSALRKYLNENSPLAGTVLENNNWDEALQNAVNTAIHKLPKSRREAFLAQYDRVFNEPQSLTPTEKKIIRYREAILESEPFKSALEDDSQTFEASKALKCLDYFVASSETPMREKAYVLLKLSYMLSEAYKINPQLKDKKFKVFSEIINDLVVQTPGEAILNTKDCSQMRHGSCAAISMARKTLVYEDKVAYIDTILKELDDKPYMEIYDITRLLEYENDKEKYRTIRAPKVRVDKAQINYDRALSENYRIIDASVLNWMKIAGSVGDGTISLEDYFAFDNRHKGFMHDSRIIKIADRSYAMHHAYLRTLIKSKNLIESYDTAKLKEQIKSREVINNEALYARTRDIALHNLENKLSLIINGERSGNLRQVVKDAEFDLSLNIKNNDELLNKNLVNYFSKNLGEEHRPKLKEEVSQILPLYREYVKSSRALSRLSVGLGDKYRMNKKLFQLGVAQREVVLRQLKLEGDVEDLMFDDLKMPDYITQLRTHLQKLRKLARTNPNSSYIQNLKAKNNWTDEKLIATLDSFENDFNVELPKLIDEKLAFYNTSYKQILMNTVKYNLNQHRDGNYEYMYAVSDRTGLTPDVKKFEKRLERVLENIEKANTHQEMSKALSELGSHNEVNVIVSAVSNAAQNIEQAVATQGFEVVAAEFGDKFVGNTANELFDLVNAVNFELDGLLGYYSQVADFLEFPTAKEIIIRAYENRGEILSDRELNMLKARFDEIDNASELISRRRQNGEKIKLPNSVYKLTDKETQSLAKIKKALPKFKRVVNREYNENNRQLKSKLEELYADLGKRKGHFWVREEGESGLFDGESIRIIEQMTGRPYHIEKDVDEIIDHIKSGKGSAASSTNVDYNGYSGHAQYIADVRPIKVIDPKTGVISYKDAILHDNTWGRRENLGRWIDASGVQRSDYANGYGGPSGFVLTDELLAGSFAENYKFDRGLDEGERYKYNKAIDGPQTEMPQEQTLYRIISGARLPGLDPRAEVKALKLMRYIFNIQSAEDIVDSLFKSLAENNYNVDTELLDKGDEIIGQKQMALFRLLGSSESKKMSIEEYNKLDENHPLKIIIQKHIIRKAFPALADDEALGDMRTAKQLAKYKNSLVNSEKMLLREYFGKNLTPEYQKSINAELKKGIKQVVKDLSKKNAKEFPEWEKQLNKIYADILKQDFDGVVTDLITELAFATGEYFDKKTNWSEEDLRVLVDGVVSVATSIFMPESIDLVKASPGGKSILRFIVREFDPVDDKELMNIYYKLLKANNAEFEEHIKNLTIEDLGGKLDTAENVIKLIQSGNSLERKRFNTEVRLHYFDEVMHCRPNSKVSKERAKFNTLYRNLQVTISPMNFEKYIKEQRADAFRRYAARPSIPNIEIRSDAQLANTLKGHLSALVTVVNDVKLCDVVKKYLQTLENINKMVENNGIEEVKPKLIFELEKLTELMKKDENLSDSVVAAEILIKKLSDSNVRNLNINQYLGVINKQRHEHLAGYSIETVSAALRSHRETLQNSIEYMVQVNVLPKFQMKSKKLIKEWIRVSLKNPESPESNRLVVELMNNMIEHHVLKSPVELLSYAIKKASEKPEKGSENNHDLIVNALKNFLTEAYNKSNRAELEFKLMSMAEKGNAVKTRDLLNRAGFKFLTKDGGHIPLFSQVGMLGLMQSLADETNNNSTLRLFVEQTGLVDDLIEAILTTDVKQIKKNVVTKARELIKARPAQDILHKAVVEKLSFMEEVNSPSKELLLIIIDEYLSELNKIHTDKSTKIWIDFYENQFRTIAQNCENLNQINLKELIASIHEECISMIDREIAVNFGDLVNTLNSTQNNIRLIESLPYEYNEVLSNRISLYKKQIDDLTIFGHKCLSFIEQELNKNTLGKEFSVS